MSEKKDNEILSQQFKDRIIQRLDEKAPDVHCPMCGNNKFILVDGLAKHTLQRRNSYEIGGRSLPCVLTVCTNCGFLAEHAVGLLGLMKDFDNSDDSLKE